MLRHALHDLMKLNRGPLPWPRAVRYMIAIGAPLAAGLIVGQSASGVIAALNAMLSSQNDLGGTLKQRVAGMAGVSLAIVVGGTIGAFTDIKYWPFVVLFICGYFVGRMHGTSLVIENIARFFAFGVVLAATLKLSSPTLIPLSLAGGVWAIAVVCVDYWARKSAPTRVGGSMREGFQRFRMGEAASWRFAIFYAATITVALLLAEEFGAQRAGWVAITTIVVMRPDGHESIQLVLQRMAGTLFGVSVAGSMFVFVDNQWALFVALCVLACLLPLCMSWHRWLGVAAVTATAMVMVHLTLFASGGARSLLSVRIYDTLLGCVLAVFGTLVASADVTRNPPPSTDSVETP